MVKSPGTSLTASLAATRILYPPPVPTGPSLMVIDDPPDRRGRGLALGRYYPIIVETDAALEELECSLNEPSTELALPDLLDRRPSQLWTDTVLVMRFEPPAVSWPWLCVVGWPDTMADMARRHGVAMARGCYTMEMFERVDGIAAHCAALAVQLGSLSAGDVRLIAGDAIPAPGSA